MLFPLLFVCALAAADGPGAVPIVNADDVLAMKHTGGWGAGVLAEFHVKANGDFEYTERVPRRQAEPPKTLRGRLTEEQIKSLATAIGNAKDGPAAEDAGVVEFAWRDGDTVRQRMYSMPRAEPCAALMAAIKNAAAKSAATAPATRPD